MKQEIVERRAYVTVEIADQTFGIPIARVREVFQPERMTRVPLASAEVAGVLNLRGRIVTAIDMRLVLGLPPLAEGVRSMAIGVDHRQESFALLVDRPGDVLDLDEAEREPTPQTLDPRWRRLIAGVHRLDDRLLLVLDVDRILATDDLSAAA